MTQDIKISISAQDKTAGAFKAVSDKLKNVKTDAELFNGVLAGLGAGISVAGIIAMTQSIIEAGDSMNDLSQRVGIAVADLAKYQLATSQSGTSMEALAKGIKGLAGNMIEHGDALKAAGISATTADEAMLQMADIFAAMPDSMEKTTLATKVFGKAGMELIPMLNLGSQGLKDAAEKSAKYAEQMAIMAPLADAFNDNLSQISMNAKVVGMSMTNDALPALLRVTKAMADAGKEGGAFAVIMAGVKADLQNAGNKMFGMPLPVINTGGATGSWDDLPAPGTTKAKDPLAEYKKLMAALGGDKATGGAARQSEASRYLETLTKQLEKAQDLSAVQQLGFDIVAGRVGKVSVAEQNNLVQLAQKIDAIKAESAAEKELTEILKDKRASSIAAGDAVSKANEEYQAILSKLLDATPTASLESQRKDVQLLTAEFEAGRLSETLYLEAVSTRLDLVGEKINTTKSLADDLGLTFSSAFEDAIVGGKSLSDVLGSLEKDIIRMVTRKLVTEPISNAITGAVKGFNPGDFIGGLFSADGGGYTGNGARSGGMDGKGGFMAMLHPQETVVDHTKGQRAGNTVVLNIAQSFAQGTSRQTTMQAAADASRQLQYAGRNL